MRRSQCKDCAVRERFTGCLGVGYNLTLPHLSRFTCVGDAGESVVEWTKQFLDISIDHSLLPCLVLL